MVTRLWSFPPGEGKNSIHPPRPKDLEGFDPKTEYSTEGKTGVRLLSKGAATQRQMGEISNLITDMTLKGAPEGDCTGC